MGERILLKSESSPMAYMEEEEDEEEEEEEETC
jgi:hypothetical protein